MREKREYRATYTVLRVDPAFLPLSKDAKLYWHTAKLDLPVSGVGVCLAHTIAGLASMSVDEAQRAEAELIESGWIKRSGAILWLVNGLRHTPNLKPKDPKHRLHIQRLLKDLPRDNAIVTDFRAYYSEWFEGPSNGPSTGLGEGPLKALPKDQQQVHAEPLPNDHPKGDGGKKEVRSKKKRKTTTTSASDDAVARETWLTAFMDDWRERYGGDMPIGPSVRPLNGLVVEWGAEEARRRWRIYLASTDAAYANAARFASTFGEYNAPRVQRRAPAIADDAHVRALKVWPFYVNSGLVSSIPDKARVHLAAADAVELGLSSSTEAFVAELKIAQPWVDAGLHNDGVIVEQMAQRLRAGQRARTVAA